MKVLLTNDYPNVAADLLSEHYELIRHSGNLSKESFIELAKDCDAVLCTLTDNIDQEIIDACPSVKIYANYAVGYNNIDIDYAASKGVIVTNTPDVLSDATAELAWGLLFSVARRINEGDRMLRQGFWHGFQPQMLLGQDIYNKTLGIIGAGRIGQRFAEKSRGYHMNLIYHNRERDLDFEKRFNATFVSRDELVEQSDFISIHVPLTEETRYMIGKREISKMKRNAILINTSRGPVIDEEALIHALENGDIFGAGLDVYDNEPNVDERLIALSNVVLTPHIGSASVESRTKMAELAALNIHEVLSGNPPKNPVK